MSGLAKMELPFKLAKLICSGGKMVRVACIMMQKDEDHLLEPWIEYHAYLFGYENLFIFDNGSTSPHTLAVLDKCEANGVTVNRDYPTQYDRKGDIIGAKIAELEKLNCYDFMNPLDCDEFFVLQYDKKTVSSNSEDIHAELARLNDDRAFRVSDAYYNIIGYPDLYWCWEHNKTFFKAGTYAYLDHGHHSGKSRLAPGKCDTRFAHLHFHHKPYQLIRAHARNKLSPYVDVADNAAVAAFAGCGSHLTKYLMESEEAYMARFSDSHAIAIPQFSDRLRSLGLVVPFAGRCLHETDWVARG